MLRLARIRKAHQPKIAELFADRPFGRVTFTSPRVVRHFAELAGAAWPSRRGTLEAVSIGPVTSRELARQGVLWIDEAELPTPRAMVEAVLARLAEMNR